VLFILLAQFTEKTAASFYFFITAFAFLFYSVYMIKESRFRKFLHFIDRRVRSSIMRFERPGIPLRGAFWFYFSCGLVFLLFPLKIATASCLILAVSDSLATLAGYYGGKKRIIGTKTLEGTATFFASAAAISFLFSFSLLPGVAATVGELVPELAPGLRKRGILDDNFTIPLLAGVAFLFI
jgi:dolichol kinase